MNCQMKFVILVSEIKIPTNMTVIIKPNATKKQIEEALGKLKKPTKKFDVDKFFGKIKWGEDSLKFQRELRGDTIS